MRSAHEADAHNARLKELTLLNVAEFLNDLRGRGIELRLDGEDRLVCNAPKAVMTPELCACIRDQKEDILAFLKPAVRDNWSALVPINARGSRPPFFCVHGVGGNVLNYSVFPRYLGPDQPVYGLQSAGLDGLTPPLDDVVAMAAAYNRHLRSVQPHGPYHLGGGSMGGMVALEMARQLKAEGETIGLLVLFDTIGPNIIRRGQVPAAKREGWHGLATEMLGRNPFAVVASRAQAKWTRFRRFRTCRACLRRGEPIPVEHRFWYIEETNYKAMYAYAYQRYDGEIVLIRGHVVEDGTYLSDPMRGWTGLAESVRIHAVDGDHETLIETPALGEVLRDCLNQASPGA